MKMSSWFSRGVSLVLVGASALVGCEGPSAADDAASLGDGATTLDDAGLAVDAGLADDASVDAGSRPPPRFSDDEVFVTTTLESAPGRACVDIDLEPPGVVDCEASAEDWDYMFEAVDGEWMLWTNSGVRGPSTRGASFGPMSLAERSMIQSGRRVPGWFVDTIGGIFTTAPWHGYDVHGTHDITPNYRVYVVDTGGARFRVQVTTYYRDGESGWVTVRFGRLGETDYEELVVDARAGGFGAPADDPRNHYAYLDLEAGAVLDLDDAAAATNTAWDLGFKRYGTISNGGASGPGAVSGALANAQSALYDADGLPIRAAFDAMTPAQALDDFLAVTSADGLRFEVDRPRPYIIHDGGVQSFFGLDDATPGEPSYFARPDVWWAIRGSRGDSYAWLHATEFDVAARSLTLGLHIQARPTAAP